ncbi:hypothetical protein GCM10018793_40570 [Streptomyces sulfonofaciens]|uniref:DUF742 domain-containing protein n=1 Tax=Streptomyces sulfonofaciens TaxID=68272 RepID=A0A919GBX6_9ACTN|nr:DUF742 domain-containing protein [Streptomyces sulfonofaciens]GHH81952.1 hypothetical protein GCM10018793_40570 [Streptomyces sulfonofaciens]
MSHWTDGLEPDADDTLVRPFTITRGRTAPGRSDVELITVVTTIAPDGEPAPRPGLEPEHRRIIRQCRTPAVVAEVCADLNLPVSVTKILVGDLLQFGLVTVRPPVGRTVGFDRDLLQAVRDGLERL